MRHRQSNKTIDRTSSSRQALKISLTKEFIKRGSIQTTMAKAKFAKPFIEKIISLSRQSNLSTRRSLIKRLNDHNTVNKLLTQIGPKYRNNISGHIRIVKLGRRQGDGAYLASLEMVDHAQ